MEVLRLKLIHKSATLLFDSSNFQLDEVIKRLRSNDHVIEIIPKKIGYSLTIKYDNSRIVGLMIYNSGKVSSVLEPSDELSNILNLIELPFKDIRETLFLYKFKIPREKADVKYLESIFGRVDDTKKIGMHVNFMDHKFAVFKEGSVTLNTLNRAVAELVHKEFIAKLMISS